MKPKTYRSLGFNVTLMVPETVAENDKLAGKDGATLESGVDNVVYRGGSCLPTFRDELAAGIEAATNILRKFEVIKDKKTGEPRKDADGNEKTRWLESEGDYLDRVIAETGRTLESFADIAQAAAAKMVYDPTASEREPAGPKTPPKSVYAQVDALISGGQAETVASSLSAILSRTVGTDRESLAKAVHEDILNETRKTKNKWAVK